DTLNVGYMDESGEPVSRAKLTADALIRVVGGPSNGVYESRLSHVLLRNGREKWIYAEVRRGLVSFGGDQATKGPCAVRADVKPGSEGRVYGAGTR
ncbi:hypothetical protein E4U53_003048, partial [Claviceps sorghi]